MRALGILLALALLATPLVARGQPAAGVLRIAYLSPGARDAHAEQLQQAFRQGLNEFGARWYVLSAAGAAITSTAPSGTSSQSGEGAGSGY